MRTLKMTHEVDIALLTGKNDEKGLDGMWPPDRQVNIIQLAGSC